MHGFELPFQPIPRKLYSRADLFQGYDPLRPASWASTVDIAIYRHFVMEGRSKPTNPYMGMMQALHDNAIMEATAVFIEGRKVVAIIGDHALGRDTLAYRQAATIARQLTRRGYLVCTGGGPGAMEAGHLGASLARSTDAALDAALARLSAYPVVPDLRRIIDSSGAVDTELVTQAAAWLLPAFELAESIQSPGESLAIPTWGYGHEPPSPLATHIAKYFQNSIREDGLLAIARQGIVCMQGQAGTIQEIFQDAAQNYYETFGPFSPMVLFGAQYWTEHFPVAAVMQKLFGGRFAEYVLITDDVEAAAGFIERFSASAG